MAASFDSDQKRYLQEASKNGLCSRFHNRRGLTASMKQYQGYWFDEFVVPGILSVQEKFRGRSDQIVITSFPKSGTTWLKALLFCITNRSSYDFTTSRRVNNVMDDNNPLLSCNPHVCVPFLEFYACAHLDDPNPNVTLLNTH
uniref:Sulfotransferase n=1 Tax=Kalanchoe fedtschenkoi TaxID=63787 RepID=A0A7N0VN76_KALFE